MSAAGWAATVGIPVLAGALAATVVAYEIRSDVACAAEEPRASGTDLWRAAAAGCVEAGGTYSMADERGQLIARCVPAHLQAGVGPKVARRVP